MKKNSHILYALLFAIAILVVLPSLYVSIRSSDPEFCLSCHYEKQKTVSGKIETCGQKVVQSQTAFKWPAPGDSDALFFLSFAHRSGQP